MAPPLSKADILRDNMKTTDPNSVTSLTLTHKALSNVSCLSEFKSLERLDLSFNNLSSLQGLEACVNLKWLSVQQNKLVNLNGVHSLPNLTVFNAAKNKLRSMDEVKSLVKLRALILNDNEISTIAGLDHLLELNTLVLSRNPIRKMGDSLAKLLSLEKVSLSNCQLEAIDSSIKACTKLKQLRLSHNEIKTLPAELSYNKRLQILDVGNNMISRWSDLEALSSLQNLRNLNLIGNPIADKAKLLKKMKKLAPGLQILNSKRMDKLNHREETRKIEHQAANVSDDIEPLKKKRKERGEMDTDSDKHGNNMNKEKFGRKTNVDATNEKEYQLEETKDHSKKQKKTKEHMGSQGLEVELDVGKGLKKMKKEEKHMEKELPVQEGNRTKSDKKSERKLEKTDVDVIDDKETPFSELFAHGATKNMKTDDGEGGKMDYFNPLVTYPAKKKKTKDHGSKASVFELLVPATEVGLGGPSAWDIGD